MWGCGEVCWGVGGKGDVRKVRRVWRSIGGRCEKVCWGVGDVRGDVGKCLGRCEKVCWGVEEGVGVCVEALGEGVKKCVVEWGRCGGLEKCVGV